MHARVVNGFFQSRFARICTALVNNTKLGFSVARRNLIIFHEELSGCCCSAFSVLCCPLPPHLRLRITAACARCGCCSASTSGLRPSRPALRGFVAASCHRRAAASADPQLWSGAGAAPFLSLENCVAKQATLECTIVTFASNRIIGTNFRSLHVDRPKV